MKDTEKTFNAFFVALDEEYFNSIIFAMLDKKENFQRNMANKTMFI